MAFIFSFGLCDEVQSQSCDLFFSEYIEGTSSNKAIEIFNPSVDEVDLNDYIIYRFNNGSQFATDSLVPQGTLLPREVFVVVNPSANAAILAQSDTIHTLTFFNGDDAIALINKSTTDTLDIIGEIGVDPGSSWPVGTGATNNSTLVRKVDISEGNPNWSTASTEWEVFPIDFTDSLGSHFSTMCETFCGLSTDLFFSEYIEGTISNKVFEIFNPSEEVIDLEDYKIYRFNNGSQIATDSLVPQGTLLPRDVFVVANPSANATILAQSDAIHTLTFYNGDDALALINKSTSDTLDIIGEIGVDPGSGWPVGNGATNNSTLIRKARVIRGNTNWTFASTEWDVFPIDHVDSIGDHSMIIDCSLNIWISDDSNNWFDVKNWSLNHIPLVTDKVLIPNGYRVNIPNGKKADALQLEVGENSVFTVNGELDVIVDQ